MIVHIGLGKTGTTSLQKLVFPKLEEWGVVEKYNPPQIMGMLRRYVATGEGFEELRHALANQPENTLISLESLAGWNPALWRENLEKNSFVFPKSSTILITLRDPVSYLTSVYVQMVHQGNVVKPEMFILSDADYNVVKPLARPNLCEIFKVDDLDYEGLVELYKKSFKRVMVVPLSKIPELNFLNYLYSLPGNLVDDLKEEFTNAKRENVSYSKRAMKLTFLRERYLSFIYLRSKSSHDQFFYKYSAPFRVKEETEGQKKDRSFSVKVLAKIRYWLSWRNFMQKIVDRLFSYQKYELPGNIPKGRNLDANENFYKELESLEPGYLILEKE